MRPRRHLLTAFAVIALFAIGARAVRAAILPPCDQTVYLIQDPSTPEDICDASTLKGCLQLTPEQYNAKDDTFKKNNPPTVTSTAACGFNDFIQLFINLSNWGLGIMAVLAVGFTVYGGQTLLLSAGNQEKVKSGKQTIWGGVLGISIVLTAWILIGFVVSALTGTGFTVFKDAAGGQFARNFFGSSNCGSKFQTCNFDNLHIQCKDTKENGDAVTQAQRVLTKMSCYTRAVDGCFGTNTDKGVKDFQKANQGCTITINGAPYSMPDYRLGGSPDGVVGPITWAFLKGADEGIQMQCPNSIATPTIGSCSGNSLITCSSDSDCAAQSAGTCSTTPPPGRCSGDPTDICDRDLICQALGVGTCILTPPAVGPAENVHGC